MLSEVMTALKELKSELQDQLAQQPEYRALLVLDRAASQLGDVLTPANPQAFVRREHPPRDEPRATPAATNPAELFGGALNGVSDAVQSEDRLVDAPGPISAAVNDLARIVETPHAAAEDVREVAPPYRPPDAAADVVHRSSDIALSAALAANELAGAADTAPLTTRNLWTVAATYGLPPAARANAHPEPRITPAPVVANAPADAAAAPAPRANISGLAALYQSAGEASGVIGVSEESGAEAQIPTAPAIAEPAPKPLNLVAPLPRLAEANAPAPSGLTAALYESTGDAPDLEQLDDRAADPAAMRPAAEDLAAAAAMDAFDQTLALAAKAAAEASKPAAPAAKTSTPPRSYLPIIAAQRLIQARR